MTTNLDGKIQLKSRLKLHFCVPEDTPLQVFHYKFHIVTPETTITIQYINDVRAPLDVQNPKI